jgi:hypothetical protein
VSATSEQNILWGSRMGYGQAAARSAARVTVDLPA